jgi:hypothetical protein
MPNDRDPVGKANQNQWKSVNCKKWIVRHP